ncbi:MAG TPA: amino acid ABC transporter permease [Gaiellaceae bacterium]|nr:amino acid ABC transporter permease [Gaiellaceae bacterium]
MSVERERGAPDRGFRYVLAEQTPLSAAAAALGAASLAVLVAGSVGVITAIGWTPSERLAEGITSRSQTAVLVAALALGLSGAALGAAIYGRLPTKPSREGAVAGVVLGLQAVALAALYWWFRVGDVEVFARNFFEFALLEEFWPRFLRAAGNTVVLALSGEAIGIAIGLVLSVFAISTRPVVRAPARLYINFFRGTPLLWQLSFFFFGIALGLRLNLGAYEVAILVLGLNAGAYSAEIFRAGIQSIERSQFEAARSLGMSHFKALRLVIMPQAVRRVIPPLTNEFVILIKDTSLVAFLGLTLSQQELMAVGRDIFLQTFNATPFLASAAGYLAVTLPMIRAVTWLERRLRSGLTGIGA